MPSRPSTPPATIPQSLQFQSTPYSRGSGSHYSSQSRNNQSDYKPYLREDLEFLCTVSFDEFLNDILHLSPEWINENTSKIQNIVGDKNFQDNVSKYCEAKYECSRYPPFIKLSNHVIRQLNTNPDSSIHFCHNDPVIVVGSHSKRKPDVVGVRCESLEVPDRSSVDNLMNDGPKEAPFGWIELLFFFEFKLEVVLKDELPRNHDAVARDHNSSTLSVGFLTLPLEGFMKRLPPSPLCVHQFLQLWGQSAPRG
ncbi:hypothetical protein EI94DRAFT_1800505 [Lactarius quietus]|nr:hypothetical protein EI94DRAFT_1800505 [Lactarius quietus]